MSAPLIGYPCLGCNRVIEVTPVTLRYRKHTMAEWGSTVCPGSGLRVPPSMRQPPASRHGDGLAATAPCGHPGRHVTTNLILCERRGCDGKAPSYAAPPACPHTELYRWATYSSCKACGRIVR